MATTAPHGGEGSDACAHGGDMSSRASQLPCPQPPTTATTRWRLVKSTTVLRAQKTDRAGEVVNKALRRQKSFAAGDAVFFELFDEDTAGVRPGVLAEPRPQERVQRHVVEHITDFVRVAPMVQILDAPVPQTLEQLPDSSLTRSRPIPSRLSKCPRSFLRTSLCAPFCVTRSW